MSSELIEAPPVAPTDAYSDLLLLGLPGRLSKIIVDGKALDDAGNERPDNMVLMGAVNALIRLERDEQCICSICQHPTFGISKLPRAYGEQFSPEEREGEVNRFIVGLIRIERESIKKRAAA